MEKLLGEGTSFEDVEKLRKQLIAQEMRIFERKEKITALTDTLRAGKSEDMRQLELQRIELLSNKEERSAYGYSNQKDWERYIKNELTLNDELEIRHKYEAIEAKIAEHERRVSLARIHRDNIREKLKNRQIFAKAILDGLRIDEQVEQVTAK